MLVLLLATLLNAQDVHAAPIAQACAGFTSQLSADAPAQVVTDSLNIRERAGRTQRRLGSVPRGTPVEITGEPRCVNGLTWWPVRAGAFTGWAAETNGEETLLAPGTAQTRTVDLRGRGNGFGGDERPNSQCPFAANLPMGYIYIDALGSTLDVTLPSERFFLYAADYNTSGTILRVPVEVCAPVGALASAIGPNGAVEAVVETVIGDVDGTARLSIRLPAVAYAGVGAWTLRVNGADLNVTLERSATPTMTYICCTTGTGATFALAGFAPNERIAVVQTRDDDGNGVIAATEVAVQEVRADALGGYAGPVTLPFGLTAVVAFVGESGAGVVRGALDDGDLTGLIAVIHASYWRGVAGPATPTVTRPCSTAGRTLGFVPPQTRDLQLQTPNMTGDDVLAVQIRLCALGYETGPLDGIFGPVTQGAVRSFEARNGQTIDGVVGPVTWGALFGPAPIRAG